MTVYHCGPCEWTGTGDTVRAHEASADHVRAMEFERDVENVGALYRAADPSSRAAARAVLTGRVKVEWIARRAGEDTP